MDNLIDKLINKNIVEKGNFTLKSGEKSNIYVDLRKLVSYPTLLKSVCSKINTLIRDDTFDALLGVPTGGYSFSQTCSILSSKPCLFLRKETKDHGKKQQIEGIWKKGDEIILIEDVINSGASILETIDKLEKLGLIIKKIIVVLKRKNEGIQKIKTEKNIPIQHLFCLEDLLQHETNSDRIEHQTIYKNIYISNIQDKIRHKKSNIILSLDLTSCHSILHLIEICGPHICGIKLHLDIITDFSPSFVLKLKELSKLYDLFVIEDRKFADIGNTTELQLLNSRYNILDFIHAVTVHSIPGPNILDVFKKHNLPVLLIQEMSSKDNLFTQEYIDQTIQIAKQHSNIVIGMIGQYKYLKETLLFTPGIHINKKGDNLGQQYKNPEEAKKNGTDIFIIGRGIYKAANPIEELLKYKKACWN